MANLLDLIVNTFPASGDVGVPLKSNLTFTLSGTNYDEDSLKEGIFVEGPDTDRYIGPDLRELEYPDNVSQGDDFLDSPGYYGIVEGTVTVSGINANTVVTFDPTRPLAASYPYKMNLTGVLESDGLTTVSGFASVSFTTGSGSIEEVPSSISTSIIASSPQAESALLSSGPLKVVSSTPADNKAQINPDIEEIEIEFNKPLGTVTSNQVSVKTEKATDHPDASITSLGDLYKILEVSGNKLKIKI